jgi:hypothetical protein
MKPTEAGASHLLQRKVSFGERGRPARLFRPLAEKPLDGRILCQNDPTARAWKNGAKTESSQPTGGKWRLIKANEGKKSFSQPPVRQNGAYLFSAAQPILRGAGFQSCCAADFQVGTVALRPAGLETCGTADLEVCATLNRYNGAPKANRVAGR